MAKVNSESTYEKWHCSREGELKALYSKAVDCLKYRSTSCISVAEDPS
jgi:hypothetical protein